MNAVRGGGKLQGGGGAAERVNGIEPSYAVWETAVLPLNYTRRGPMMPDLLGYLASWALETFEDR